MICSYCWTFSEPRVFQGFHQRFEIPRRFKVFVVNWEAFLSAGILLILEIEKFEFLVKVYGISNFNSIIKPKDLRIVGTLVSKFQAKDAP